MLSNEAAVEERAYNMLNDIVMLKWPLAAITL